MIQIPKALPSSECRPLTERILSIYLILYGVLLLSTELLSLFDCIGRLSVSLLWGVGVALLAWKCVIWAREEDWPRRIHLLLKTKSFYIVAIIAFGIFLSGVWYPPLNHDSMSYHLARVVHWIHQGSIRYYQTDIERQLYQMPLAEIAILHLQLIAKGDLLAFLPQFAAWLVCLLAVSCICRELGGGLRSQWFSIVLAATLSMGILQASSTQNDLVVGSFFLIFIYFLLKCQGDWRCSVFAGLAMGLALATKGTAYLYVCIPGSIFGGCILFKSKAPKADFARLAAIIIIALSMNFGIYFRSLAYSGKPLTGGETAYFVETRTPWLLALNAFKHTLNHILLPDHSYVLGRCLGKIPSLIKYTDFETKFDNRLIQWLCKIFPDINDESITWDDCELQALSTDIHEDFSGDGLHFLLIVIAIAIVFWRGRKNRLVVAYASSMALTWLLFTTLLKWNVWQPRLHLPIFLASMPMVGTQLINIRCRKVCTVVAILLLASGGFCTMFGKPRVLSAKIVQMLNGRWSKRADNYMFIDNVSELVATLPEGCSIDDIGLYCDKDAPVYPLFVKLGIHASKAGRIAYAHDRKLLVSTLQSIPGYVQLYDGTPFKLFMRDEQGLGKLLH